MRKSALQALVDTARALPGDAAPVPPTSVPPAPEASTVEGLPDLPAMRRQLGLLLQQVAAVLDPELMRALKQAAKSWDQADAISVLSPELMDNVASHRAAWMALRGHNAPGVDAAAVEAVLTLDAACGLVTLFEKRLAPLVRLRLRSDEPDLLPGGRPFLDLSAALREAARAWT